jgi:hypothetical protein
MAGRSSLQLMSKPASRPDCSEAEIANDVFKIIDSFALFFSCRPR